MIQLNQLKKKTRRSQLAHLRQLNQLKLAHSSACGALSRGVHESENKALRKSENKKTRANRAPAHSLA